MKMFMIICLSRFDVTAMDKFEMPRDNPKSMIIMRTEMDLIVALTRRTTTITVARDTEPAHTPVKD